MPRPPAATPAFPSRQLATGRRRARCAGLLALFGWVGACTVSSDEFEPELVAGGRAGPSGSAGIAGSAAESPTCVGASCPDEGDGCADGGCAGSGALESDAGVECELGPCRTDAECTSRVCDGSCCAAPSCSDGSLNGAEADVDCGVACDVRCDAGERCLSVEDCKDGLGCPSSLARCTPAACDNGVRDGAELLIDCGGGECAGCVDGTACTADTDCASGSCDTSGRCGASCSDGARNQDELGVDCGGVCGGLCPATSACSVGAECVSGVCGPGNCALASDATCCQVASCTDGALNGDETDRDCGSSDPACPRCAPGSLCQADAQCASGACEAGRCCGGSTGDCTRCAERLSPTVDCSSGPAGSAANCAAFLACLSSNASVCTTRSAAGCTNDPGGACNHNTFGGNDGLGVQQAARVLAEAGCAP